MTRRRKTAAEFLNLIHRFPLSPIMEEKSAFDASDFYSELLLKGDELTPVEEQYLSILGALMREYEEKHSVLRNKTVSPRRILKSFMDEHELSQSELARQIGTQQSVISEILSGKRSFSKDVILSLSQRFHVRPDLFMQKKRSKKVG